MHRPQEKAIGVDQQARFVEFRCADDYYESIDMAAVRLLDRSRLQLARRSVMRDRRIRAGLV
jgi:hypothetical protein